MTTTEGKRPEPFTDDDGVELVTSDGRLTVAGAERLLGEPSPGTWYVVDVVGSAGVVAGPFPTAELAEAERLELNIADDCDVRQRVGGRCV